MAGPGGVMPMQPELISRVTMVEGVGVGVISINRPARRNALTRSHDQQLEALVQAHEKNDAVRVLLITGEGPAFCAGADLSVLRQAAVADQIAYDPASHLRYLYLTRLGKPVVAAIDGPAYGLGFALALHCDVRVLSPRAVFRAPFAELGLIGELGLPWLIARLAGQGRAFDWLLSSRKIDAQEALATGLASRILDAEGFAQAALAHAAALVAQASDRSLRVIKRQIWGVYQQSLAEAEIDSGVETLAALRSDDFRQRMAALVLPSSKPSPASDRA